MSKVEWKRAKFKIIFFGAVAVLTILLVVFLCLAGKGMSASAEPGEEKSLQNDEGDIPFENLKIEYKNGNEMSFSAKLKKEKMEKLLSDRGVDAPFVFSLLPGEIEVECDAKINFFSADGYVSLNLLRMQVNGFGIPKKLLSDIGELKLDFKRSLVYN